MVSILDQDSWYLDIASNSFGVKRRSIIAICLNSEATDQFSRCIQMLNIVDWNTEDPRVLDQDTVDSALQTLQTTKKTRKRQFKKQL